MSLLNGFSLNCSSTCFIVDDFASAAFSKFAGNNPFGSAAIGTLLCTFIGGILKISPFLSTNPDTVPSIVSFGVFINVRAGPRSYVLGILIKFEGGYTISGYVFNNLFKHLLADLISYKHLSLSITNPSFSNSVYNLPVDFITLPLIGLR